MKMLKRLFGFGAENDGTATRVSTACRRAIIYNESIQGVDLPTWRTPEEVEELRRTELRGSFHVVRTGTND